MTRLPLLFAGMLAVAMLPCAGCSSKVSGPATGSGSDIGDLHDRIAEIHELHDGDAGSASDGEYDAEDP